MTCPRCDAELERLPCEGGRLMRCSGCDGLAVTIEMLRRFAPPDRVDSIWVQADDPARAGKLGCPSCNAHLRRTSVECADGDVALDVCRVCHQVWFDADELHAFSPNRSEPPSDDEIRRAREHLGVDPHRVTVPHAPDELWRAVVTLRALFG